MLKKYLIILAPLVFAWSVAQEALDRVHHVVDINGAASFSREGWQSEQPLLFGVPLLDGDLIHLDNSLATVTIVCADLTLSSIDELVSPVNCPQEVAITMYQGQKIRSGRGETTYDFPKMLAPRATRLLTDKPNLRWQAVEGVSSYTVTFIEEPDVILWSLETSQTNIDYPAFEPLQSGHLYRLEVSALIDGEVVSSSLDNERDLGFSLLSEDKTIEVRIIENQIESLVISDMVKRFLVSNVYGANRLYSESILLLEGSDSILDEFAVQQLLGQLLVSSKLYEQAEARFNNALTLAQTQHYGYGVAQSHENLADIFRQAKGNFDAARVHYQQALDLYEQIGDTNAITRLTQILDDF